MLFDKPFHTIFLARSEEMNLSRSMFNANGSKSFRARLGEQEYAVVANSFSSFEKAVEQEQKKPPNDDYELFVICPSEK